MESGAVRLEFAALGSQFSPNQTPFILSSILNTHSNQTLEFAEVHFLHSFVGQVTTETKDSIHFSSQF